MTSERDGKSTSSLDGFESERFDLRAQLGRGASGIVYEAFDTATNNSVALKLMRSVSASALYHFKNEFRALANIHHPNLVSLYELHNDGEHWFFTMELLAEASNFREHVRPSIGDDAEYDAPTLTSTEALADAPGDTDSDCTQTTALGEEEIPLRSKRVRRRGGAVDYQRLRSALLDISRGLQALHSFGILHRDLKPANVLIEPSGRAVVLDFGLVQTAGREPMETTVGEVHGTPAYLSPEQANLSELTPASDWYSVGVMLHEAMTGRRPFEGSNRTIVEIKTRTDALPIRQIVHDAPEDLCKLCDALLSRTPSDRPSAEEIIAILDDSATLDSSATVRSRAAQEFVGRHSELKQLWEHYEASQQETVIAQVSGLSGSGKSTLCDHFLDEIHRKHADTFILRGRCQDSESVPFKALDEIVDQLSERLRAAPDLLQGVPLRALDYQALAQLFPVLERVPGFSRSSDTNVDSLELRRIGSWAFRTVLQFLSKKERLVLCIDDLQWADQDSIALLREALSSPAPQSLLVLLGHRRDSQTATSFVAEIARQHTTVKPEITLGPLSAASAKRLALQILNSEPPEVASKIAEESGGDPFLLHELALARLAGDSQEDSLESLVGGRFKRRSTAEQKLLELVCLPGPALPLFVLRHAVQSEEGLSELITQLRSAHFLRRGGLRSDDAIETYHARLRDAIVATMPNGWAEKAHLRLAATMDSLENVEPELLAVHWLGANVPNKAFDAMLRAAERSRASLAFERAARLYARCIEINTGSAEQMSEIAERHAQSLADSGQGAASANAFETLSETAAGIDILDYQQRAASQYLVSGRTDQAVSLLRKVLPKIGLRFPRTNVGAVLGYLYYRLLLRLRGWKKLSQSHALVPSRIEQLRLHTCSMLASDFIFVDLPRGAYFHARVTILSQEHGRSAEGIRAMAQEAGWLASQGSTNYDTALVLLEDARAHAASHELEGFDGVYMAVKGIMDCLVGKTGFGTSSLQGAIDLLEGQSSKWPWELSAARYFMCIGLRYTGRIEELRESSAEVLADGMRRNDLYTECQCRAEFRYFLELARDNLAGARAELSIVAEKTAQTAYLSRDYWQLHAGMECDLYEGRGEDAWQDARASWPRLRRSLLLSVQSLRMEIGDTRGRAAISAALQCSGRDRAKRLLDASKFAKKLTKEDTDWGLGLGHLLWAMVDRANGHRDAEEEHLSQALTYFESSKMRLHAEVARYRIAERRGEPQAISASLVALEDLGIARPDRMLEFIAPAS